VQCVFTVERAMSANLQFAPARGGSNTKALIGFSVPPAISGRRGGFFSTLNRLSPARAGPLSALRVKAVGFRTACT